MCWGLNFFKMSYKTFDVALTEKTANALNFCMGQDKTKAGMRCIIACDYKYDNADQLFDDMPNEFAWREYSVQMKESPWFSFTDTSDFSPWNVQLIKVEERSFADTTIGLIGYIFRNEENYDAVPTVVNILVAEDGFGGEIELKYVMKMIERSIVKAYIYHLFQKIKEFF